MRRAIVGAMIGLLYGAMLGFLSLLAMGAGHGTVVPSLLSSAPFGVVGLITGWLSAPPGFVDAPHVGFAATLIGAPLIWAALGSLVALSSSGKMHRLTQMLVLLHYASGFALVATAGDFDYLERLLRLSPEILVMWATVYLVGQVALWWRIGRHNQL